MSREVLGRGNERPETVSPENVRPETVSPENVRPGLFRLFITSLLLSLFAFGGGSTILAMSKRKYVDQLGWLTETELMDRLTLAQAAPGATTINASILIGYRFRGVPGALACALATAIPPVVIIAAVTGIYMAVRDNTMVTNAMKGMRAGAAALVASVTLSLIWNMFKRREWLMTALFVTVFTVIQFVSISTYVILAAGLAVGIINAVVQARRAAKAGGGKGVKEDADTKGGGDAVR